MFTVGLTGGIGSGKSTVADLFAALGVPVIDTDVIARELTAPGERGARSDPCGFRGCGDAGQTAAWIAPPCGAWCLPMPMPGVSSKPFFIRAFGRRSSRLAHDSRAPYVLVVIPLLVETGGYRDLLDRVLVVDCPEDLQIARVMARSGLTRDEVVAILAAQASRAERLAVADDVIVNTAYAGRPCVHEVATLHQRYLDARLTRRCLDFPSGSATIEPIQTNALRRDPLRISPERTHSHPVAAGRLVRPLRCLCRVARPACASCCLADLVRNGGSGCARRSQVRSAAGTGPAKNRADRVAWQSRMCRMRRWKKCWRRSRLRIRGCINCREKSGSTCAKTTG